MLHGIQIIYNTALDNLVFTCVLELAPTLEKVKELLVYVCDPNFQNLVPRLIVHYLSVETKRLKSTEIHS